MVKFYREEISYKRLYGDIDLDKDLEIDWSRTTKIEKPILETEEVVISNELENIEYCLDEEDYEFIKEQNMTEKDFRGLMEETNKKYNIFIEKRLKEIKFKIKINHCDICGYSDCDSTNDMLNCQGCEISVHQECYGVENYTKFWLCKKCEENDFNAKCEFCDKTEGLLKKTDCNEWIHVLCAMGNQTLSFVNTETKEPVDTTKYEPIEGECIICSKKSNLLVECSYVGCENAFHVTCACNNLYIDINNSRIYCNRHKPDTNMKVILSRRKINQVKEGYKLLKKEVYEREDVELTKCKETEFSNLVMKGYSEFFEEQKNIFTHKKFLEFWLQKKEKFGLIFEDFYYFANKLMEMN